jgi:alpha-beta hydrolase superfamily lysophospholipase
MTFTLSRLARPDGTSLALYSWPAPSGAIKAAIQIAHGMVEHAARYDRLAQALGRAGYAVYASDHRGHGQTAQTPEELGHFADQDGWRALVEDQRLVNDHVARERPGVPRVLYGHSFGSFVTQAYLYTHGETVRGAILSGSNGGVAGRVKAMRLAAYAERLRVGPRGTSKLLLILSFGDFNMRFRPTRTAFDWLSRDPSEVDKYIADPLCGYEISTQAWIDLMSGMIANADPANQRRVPKGVAIYIFSGERDPVGRGGTGPRSLAAAYQRAGVANVSCKLYPDARHEMINETNRDQVTGDLIAWLDTNVAQPVPTNHSASQHA